jgi:hypothetical protein
MAGAALKRAGRRPDAHAVRQDPHDILGQSWTCRWGPSLSASTSAWLLWYRNSPVIGRHGEWPSPCLSPILACAQLRLEVLKQILEQNLIVAAEKRFQLATPGVGNLAGNLNANFLHCFRG